MGDAGEGLVDTDSRIQERQDELDRQSAEKRATATMDPEVMQALESLRLARAELEQQLAATLHERRRAVIRDAMAEIDRRMAEVRARVKTG